MRANMAFAGASERHARLGAMRHAFSLARCQSEVCYPFFVDGYQARAWSSYAYRRVVEPIHGVRHNA